eukprot:2402926-Amphidinium_carterae.1
MQYTHKPTLLSMRDDLIHEATAGNHSLTCKITVGAINEATGSGLGSSSATWRSSSVSTGGDPLQSATEALLFTPTISWSPSKRASCHDAGHIKLNGSLQSDAAGPAERHSCAQSA